MITQVDPNYNPDTATYSPPSGGPEARQAASDLGLTEDFVPESPVLHDHWSGPIASVPKPPDPTVGGQTGIRRMFGFTTGIRPAGWSRQPLTGTVLIMPNMTPMSPVGPVGRSNRSQRLYAGTQALYRDYMPDPQQIAAAFTSPNPLGAIPANVGDRSE